MLRPLFSGTAKGMNLKCMPKLVERALDFTVVGVKSKSMRVAALLKEKN